MDSHYKAQPDLFSMGQPVVENTPSISHFNSGGTIAIVAFSPASFHLFYLYFHESFQIVLSK